MRLVRPVWLTHSGEKKDFEVYSLHVSPDGKRLVTAAGGASFVLYLAILSSERGVLSVKDTDHGPFKYRWLCSHLVDGSNVQCRRS